MCTIAIVMLLQLRTGGYKFHHQLLVASLWGVFFFFLFLLVAVFAKAEPISMKIRAMLTQMGNKKRDAPFPFFLYMVKYHS